MKRTQIVAHDISIPVRFQCSIAKSRWAINSGCVVKWCLGYGGWEVVVRLVDSKDFPGLRQSLPPEDLPPELAAALPAEGKPIPAALRNTSFEVLVGWFPDKNPKDRIIDHWALRSAMLELRESNEDLRDFLNRFGGWARGFEPFNFTRDGEWDPAIVGPWGIWRQRSDLIEALRKGANEWFKSHKAPSGFYARDEFPHYIHTDTHCAEAIATSITVDFLRGVKFGICPRSDCRKPFAKERKGKIYCSQYCAHLVSVRRSRNQQSG